MKKSKALLQSDVETEARVICAELGLDPDQTPMEQSGSAFRADARLSGGTDA